MSTWYSIRVIENANSEKEAIEKLCSCDISENHLLSDVVIQIPDDLMQRLQFIVIDQMNNRNET